MWTLQDWRLAAEYVRQIKTQDKTLREVPIVKHCANGRDTPIRARVRFEDGVIKMTVAGTTDYVSLRLGEEAYLEVHTGNVSAPLQFTLAVTRLASSKIPV